MNLPGESFNQLDGSCIAKQEFFPRRLVYKLTQIDNVFSFNEYPPG
jgi:hypothetical protein